MAAIGMLDSEELHLLDIFSELLLFWFPLSSIALESLVPLHGMAQDNLDFFARARLF